MRNRQLLDGLWQFLPLAEPLPAPPATPPPTQGFAATPIRVPGYWNTFPPAVGGDWDAYHHYHYPTAWQAAPAAWLGTTFQPAECPEPDKARTWLRFDAVAGHAFIWLNGQWLGDNRDSFLPFEFDVSTLLRPGNNTLAVYVAPPPQRDGLWLQPCGSWVGWYMRGIWQSVALVRVPRPAVCDIFVQPSVRQGTLTVSVTANCDAHPTAVHVRIRDGEKSVLTLGPANLPAGTEPTTVTLSTPWPNARYWCPDDPHLYHADAVLRRGNEVVDTHTVRFGFREFWIDGTEFRLNGERLRLFGDSWHYMGAAQQNPAYARTWFRFCKEIGANAIRTHAMPYPPCYFDVADELGMLIIDETAVYGSAGTLAFGEADFWEQSRAHLRRLVLRDRNHPAVIFWSACNETVWKGGAAIFPGLLSLAETARALDPTRLVSFDENDCDVGGAAVLHAGHYGTPQHWERVWRRDRPLVLHEFSALYHGGPEAACPYGNESVYADYHARLRATGEDAAEMFLQLRRLGAASITPWNLNWYGLRPGPAEPVEELAPELLAGGPQFERIGSYALTLNYGYRPGAPAWEPNAALAPLARCYRRQRCYVQHLPRQAFAGAGVRLEAWVWNDTPGTLRAELRLRPADAEHATPLAVVPVELAPHGHAEVTLRWNAASVPAPTTERVVLELYSTSSGTVLDAETWEFAVHPRRPPTALRSVHELMLKGQRPTLTDWAEFTHDPDATIVLTELLNGTTLLELLAQPPIDTWLRTGGRLLALPMALADDPASILSPVRRSYNRAFIRAAAGDPLLAGLTDAHFRDWGPHGEVAALVFERPTTGPALTPLDVGDAAAGLAYTPLVIVPHGSGHVIVTGLPLNVRRHDTPAAALLWERLCHGPLPALPRRKVVVGRAAAHRCRSQFKPIGLAARAAASGDDVAPEVRFCDGTTPTDLEDPALAPAALAEFFERGGTLFLTTLTPETAADWADRLALPLVLEEEECCNVARAAPDDALLAGLNNFDFCWVDRDEQQAIVRHTLPMDLGTTLIQTVATRWEGYQSAHEQHKVALMLRRMTQFRGPRAVVVRVPRGHGTLILSQLLLHEARGRFLPRAQRILSRWLDTSGAARYPAASPLAPRPATALRGDGYVAAWLVLGPFADADGHPLDHVFVDETALAPRAGTEVAQRAWQRIATALPYVDLGSVFATLPPRDRVTYAAVYVHAAQDRTVLLDAPDLLGLLLGADGGIKVWLNDVLVGRFDFVRELVLDNDHIAHLPLRQGWNTLVLKLHNPAGAWRFAARFVTAAGEPASDLTCQTESPV